MTVGAVVRLTTDRASVAVGRDRTLATLADPRCPAATRVDVEAYLQSTLRDATLVAVALDCARWRAAGDGYRYDDPDGTVRSVRYGTRGLRIDVGGAGYTAVDAPVGFVQADLTIADRRLRVRVHEFRRNDAARVVSRKRSAAAAAGEAGFWDVLLGDVRGDDVERATLARLARAARRDPRDGRTRFLLAMLHLYRFGQRTADFRAASDDAKAELRAANAWFAKAVPLLWDEERGRGDSRVPGFAAAAKWLEGLVDGDAALRDAGLADLERAVRANAFFNVFDYIPVIQAAAPADPAFQAAFARIAAYLGDPATLACVGTQPEICGNAGFAPRNLQGSLILFGDVYAKAGDLAAATSWYGLAAVLPDTRTWRFQTVVDDRRTHAAARVALYRDADPTNDPPIIGAGAEACAACHDRSAR
jgi:hypothetical protein